MLTPWAERIRPGLYDVDPTRPGRTGHRQRFEGVTEIMCRTEAMVGLFFETSPHQFFQNRRHTNPAILNVRDILFEDRMHRLDNRVTAKSACPREHLVKDHSE